VKSYKIVNVALSKLSRWWKQKNTHQTWTSNKCKDSCTIKQYRPDSFSSDAI